MATASQVIDRFAPLTGLLPSTLGRIVRALRADDQMKIGGKGGGKSAAHLDAPEMTNFLCALAGPQPSDAPEAVRLIRPLVCFRSKELRGEVLGELLDNLIRSMAVAEVRALALQDLSTWELTLSLDPLFAWMPGTADDENELVQFTPPDRNGRPSVPTAGRAMYRLTKLSIQLFTAAGELVADTRRLKGLSNQLPHLDAASGSAAPGNENAGHLLAEGPAPIGDQTRGNGTRRLNTLDSSLGEIDFQGYAVPSVGHPLLHRLGVNDHGRRKHCATSRTA